SAPSSCGRPAPHPAAVAATLSPEGRGKTGARSCLPLPLAPPGRGVAEGRGEGPARFARPARSLLHPALEFAILAQPCHHEAAALARAHLVVELPAIHGALQVGGAFRAPPRAEHLRHAVAFTHECPRHSASPSCADRPAS